MISLWFMQEIDLGISQNQEKSDWIKPNSFWVYNRFKIYCLI